MLFLAVSGFTMACEGGVEIPDQIFETEKFEGYYSGTAIATNWIMGGSTSHDTSAANWVVTALNDSTVRVETGVETENLVLDSNGAFEAYAGSSNVYQVYFRNDSIIVYQRNGGLGGGWYYNAWLEKQ